MPKPKTEPRPHYVGNISALCKELGISRPLFYKIRRLHKNNPGRKSDGRFDVQAWRDFIQSVGQGPAAGGEGDQKYLLECERLRLICAKLALEYAAAEGEYVSRGPLVRWLREKNTVVRNSLLALPSRLAQMCAMKDAAEISEILDREIRAALENMANDPPKPAKG